MANQKRKVSSDDFLKCHAYFQRAIKNNRFMKHEGAGGSCDLAVASFLKLKTEVVDTESVNAFQSWLDEFVDASTWSRCYRSLNQKKYLNQTKQHAITITHDAYLGLKNRAERYSISLSAAIIGLLHPDNSLDKHIETPDLSLDSESNESKQLNNVLYLVPKHQEDDLDEADLYASEPYVAIEEDDFEPTYDSFGRMEQPRKPEGYDFRKNESYKRYRKHINTLTIKNPDEELIHYFTDHINWYLKEDNCEPVGEKLLSIRQNLLDNKLFSTEFNPELLALSKDITVSDLLTEAYADELSIYLCDFFGCNARTISSGNKKLYVFVGNKNHVQIAFKTFHYLNAFLSDEVEQFTAKCHKNTKRKNRLRKAGYHANKLLYIMFHPDILDTDGFKLFSDEQGEYLADYAFKNIGLYYDKNEPIGGWYQPPKNKKRNEDFFLW